MFWCSALLEYFTQLLVLLNLCNDNIYIQILFNHNSVICFQYLTVQTNYTNLCMPLIVVHSTNLRCVLLLSLLIKIWCIKSSTQTITALYQAENVDSSCGNWQRTDRQKGSYKGLWTLKRLVTSKTFMLSTV